MKVFYDLELVEGTQTKRFCGIPYGQTAPTIELISIGMVDDTGREYYAISNEFNLREAWERYNVVLYKGTGEDDFKTGKDDFFGEDGLWHTRVYWLRENVLFPIWVELICLKYNKPASFIKGSMTGGPNDYPEFTYKSLKRLIKKYGKSRKQIAEEVKGFCEPKRSYKIIPPITVEYSEIKNPIFYGYYSAFKHVCLAWLFGKMIDLPRGFPMYTIDLKQMLDEKAQQKIMEVADKEPGVSRFEASLKRIQQYPDYPKNPGEHNSLQDAKFNKQLHYFLQTL